LRRTVVWLVFAVVLVFVAGFGSGTIAAKRATNADHSTYLKSLVDRYDLSPDQTERIRQLLAAEGTAIDRILDRVEAEVKNEIAAARRTTQELIRETFDESQRIAFDRDRAATSDGG
jgi:hypothetical protein